ncbi:hypothetical protein AN1V17_37070 [Vallitalea sediminicola]
MNSRQIIKDVIEFNSPKRIGLDFNKPHQDDIECISVTKLKNHLYEDQMEWDYYEDVLREVPDFKGEVRRNPYGNIYGRFEEKTSGECIKGVLQGGWEYLNSYKLPQYDESYEDEVKRLMNKNKDKYLLGILPIAVFSTIRDLRKIDNLLMDVILEKDNVIRLLSKIEELILNLINKAGILGFDGVIIYDDWGTQTALLINPVLWREVFKPIYARIVEAVHNQGMHLFIHSCGYVYDIIEDFIEIGVDVLQFDQPELVGIKKLSAKFGGRVTFWSPVDIQKVMATGDKEYIQNNARDMVTCFGGYGGGFIAKDYPTWEDIDVKEEWAQWAREVFES